MRDIMALCKVYMINIMSNKFAFVYNLLLPIIYFIYKNVNLSSATNDFNNTTADAQKSINWTIFIQLLRQHLRYDCDYKN
ncbi:hypothetical protein EFN48_08170 [Leuconostoc pseudomesenteroides]|nr:hypothetical protein [Leuconostoc pseudomesenteroides]